jgi:electron transport complex protein RnfD
MMDKGQFQFDTTVPVDQIAAIRETGTLPFFDSLSDGVTCATPLGEMKTAVEMNRVAETFASLSTPDKLWDYAIGNLGGCIGETSALALLCGGILLIALRIVKWQIPVAYIGTVAILSALVHMGRWNHPVLPAVAFQLLVGGLFLGAFFMATDMVTSPMTNRGCLIFGIGCGIITCVIRDWGSYPEGVMFSIVIMNALTPLIDRFTTGKPFGFRPPKPVECKEKAG